MALTPSDLRGRATGDVGREGPSEDEPEVSIRVCFFRISEAASSNSPWAAVLEKECRG